MSVLFNHACQYEFFEGNPIRLVRQSAKRRSAPVVLTAGRNQDPFRRAKDSRENPRVHSGVNRHSAKRTVRSQVGRYQLLCKNNERGTLHRARFCGAVQNGILAEAGSDPSTRLRSTRQVERTVRLLPARRLGFCSRHSHGKQPYWGQAILHRYLRPAARELGIETRFGWHTFRHTYSTLLRSVGTEFKVMQELLRHSTIRSTLDVYTQAITPAKQNAQAAVMSLVFPTQ
jgi:integrase